MEKSLAEITRAEWIVFNWIETTQSGDEERMFTAMGRRTPDEAAQAGTDFDETEEALKELKEKENNLQGEP
jgi:hypothetical protein